ncbi:hypothetical protein Smp_169580.1 [Schistosoma mansoni]|uniref:hypothetical protein n=1 Tax=Schistosoma mansoni TaxID=6183 RepID=UPI00022DC4FD|nr:hypothetical protein Smp_169580.1 [Schistosoma mansoni]|eukprot:XP_018653811.1 hypothetical protein Smp_169580.1 [Schistosoma mansoni]
MSNYPPVFIGLNSYGGSEVHESVYSLIQFLYETHQEFDLEGCSTETYILPKDELTLIQLVLRDLDKDKYPIKQEDISRFWYRMCRYRLYRHRILVDDNEYVFCTKVEEYLKVNNLVDRILIARRLLEEFFENSALKTKLFYYHYIVQSNKLDWFEHLMVEIMADFNECVLLETLLSYLGLAVNIKDSLRFLRIFNLPYRGLNEQSFTSLRKLARQDNLSVTQVAISFVGRMRLGDSSYAPECDHPLRRWSSGLIHLVDSINKCHDVLSGVADDSLLASGTANSLMTVDDAVKSVCQCIHVSCSILRKPGVIDGSMHEKMKTTINFSEIPDVCDSLIKRIYQLSSTNIISNMCCDTPDRPLHAGGTVRGRGAFKLIRVLLVTESERLKIASTKYSNSLLTTTSPYSFNDCSNTPQNHLTKSNTPTTDGRTCKLLQMFMSPSTPIVKKLSPFICDHISPQIQMNDENKFPSIPKRTVMSHYQSNLEWVSGHCSPLVSYAYSINETSSLPCWQVVNEDSRSNISFIKSNYSEHGTPTKLSSLKNKRSRTLFTEDNGKISGVGSVRPDLLISRSSKRESQEVTRYERRSQQTIQHSNHRKSQLKKISSVNNDRQQRSLLEFFKI